MSVRKIRLLGDPILRTPASCVTSFDGELRRLVKDLSDTLVEAGGAGLAAPQIGVLLRVFVYVDADPVSPTYQQVRHLVNPVAADTSVETATEEEGCLSIPDIFGDVTRPARVVVAKSPLQRNSAPDQNAPGLVPDQNNRHDRSPDRNARPGPNETRDRRGR